MHILFKQRLLDLKSVNKKDHEPMKVLCISCYTSLHLQDKTNYLDTLIKSEESKIRIYHEEVLVF
jgi:hypothetical protein